MSARSGALGRAALVAGITLALDQASKAAIRSGIEPGERVEVLPGLDLVRVANEGIAFGLLEGAGAAVVVVSAFAFVVLLGYLLAVGGRPGMWLPLGLFAGGALGNLLDRLRLGSVTDFIDLPRWPAFNLADVAITAGLVVLAVIMLRSDEQAEDGEQTGGER